MEENRTRTTFDLMSLLLYYKSGPLAVAEEMRPFQEHGLVQEALKAMREKFRSPESEGPTWTADFQEAQGEMREQIKMQSYLQMQRFLRALSDE